MPRDIVLDARDGKCAIEASAARSSHLLLSMLDECPGSIVVPLPDFSASTVRHFIEFAEHHESEPLPEVEAPLRQPLESMLSSWDRNFLNAVRDAGEPGSCRQLLALLTLTTYLDAPGLRNLCAASIAADLQRCASDSEIAALFGQAGIDDAAVKTVARDFPWLAD